jgi:hypothetical protein
MDFKREISRDDLFRIIRLHELYLDDSSKGRKANLSDHFLRGVSLENVDL